LESEQWEQLAKALAEMARDLAAQSSLGTTLDRVVAHAVGLVDGCEAAGVMMVRRGKVETLAASDNAARASDRLQEQSGEGPCFDAARNQHEVYRITDMTSRSDRWPQYAPKAREIGIGSVMGFSLFVDEERSLGALDLYSSRAGAFGTEHEHVGWLLAAHASVALSNANQVAHLNTALETSRQIGEAVGILMTRHGLRQPDAFSMLVKASQNSNLKVRDLADTVTYTGDLPTKA
jgi:transcriptional regulator with GAF, ATPase, and Fis domain